MFTEAITRWLHKLFAWWPWQQSRQSDYAHTGSTLNKSTTQESLLRTTVDGSIPQPGTTSVVVEHAETKQPSEMNRSTTEERTERSVSPPLQTPPISEEPTDTPVEALKERSVAAEAVPPPTAAQKLEFLRYLVKRGIVNEGFAAGQVPEQYKGK